jgi:metallo-beta-lactamase class B
MRLCHIFAPLLTLAAVADAQSPAAWSRPIAPFRIVGPIHYVGTEGLSAYLIKTNAGAILLDGTLPGNAEAIRRNVEASGVPIRSVRFLLLTHAHFDHAGGLAKLKAWSGARLVAGAGDRAALETGRHVGDNENGVGTFPAVAVDRAIGDGEAVRLGEVTVTAVATPGHTAGCTSWTMRVVHRGRPLRVVFPCSLTVAGNRLRGNRGHPGIVADYRRSFARLEGVRADIVLPAHPEFADVLARGRRNGTNGDGSAFVDRTLLPTLVRTSRTAFEAEMAKQRR